ncbi:MAG TPA: hypothetical protein VFU00_07125, partial [Gemmatimonadales bacterium]|nr:hypothetical protein [Gemmatimonadales bacterium]
WNLPGDPLAFEVAVTFTPDGTGTRLAIHFTFADARAVRTAVERYGVIRGGEETLERIARYLGEGQ